MEQFEANWERIKDEDDPRRCQGVRPTKGQCRNIAVEGSTFCPGHGGNKAFEAEKKRKIRNYKLNKFHLRIQELGDSSYVMDLREEIALLRMLIEEKVNQCNDNTDLILVSGPLSDLVVKVEKLVTSCNRLDFKLGGLLDRTKVVQYAQSLVRIVAKYVTDEVALEKISEEFLTTLEQT